jgi:IMP dehydrogenase
LNPQTFSSEGVEGYISFTGPLQYVIQGFASGIRSGMSYSGAFNLKQLREKVQFVQITNSGFKESNVHGITKME